uniref:WD_REPEATS_REGION domain-containing protein n=1 Tax=Panagrellus redivivus TaxID=6233 RepID=A0A7E4VCL6_PANRE
MKNLAPVDSDVYPVVKPSFDIHETAIVGFDLFHDDEEDFYALISISQDSVKTWKVSEFGDEVDITELSEYNKIRCGVQSYDISQNGKTIILVDAMNVLHIIKRTSLTKLEGKTVDKGFLEISNVCLTADGLRIFATSFTKGLQIFDFEGVDIMSEPYDKVPYLTAAKFSRNGKYLATGTERGSIELFDGMSLKQTFKIGDSHAKRIRVLQFDSEAMYLLAGSDDGTLSLHALLDGCATRLRYFTYHTGLILSASFDVAGNSALFVSSSTDKRVVIWNTNTGEASQVFKKCFNRDTITAVNFSRNGRYVLSGTEKGNVIIHRILEAVSLPLEVRNTSNLDDVQLSDDDNGELNNDVNGNLAVDVELSESDEEVPVNRPQTPPSPLRAPCIP